MKKDNKNQDLPYEKFLRFGAENLTESELLAIIIRTGTKDENAQVLAKKVLSLAKYPKCGLLGLYDLSVDDLMKIKGIGPVKAVKLKCITELSMRIVNSGQEQGICFRDASEVAAYFMEKLIHRNTECVMLVCLDGKGQLLSEQRLSEGSVKMSLVSPREIFMEAVRQNAVNIILVHNHPSGDMMPSKEDIMITDRMAKICTMVGIPLIDHVIVGDDNHSYFSFKEKGMVEYKGSIRYETDLKHIHLDKVAERSMKDDAVHRR